MTLDGHAMLPGCLHVICASHLEANLDNVQCATCYTPFNRDIALQLRHPLTERALSQGATPLCSKCLKIDENEPAIGRCAQCELDLCSMHVERHQTYQPTREHIVTLRAPRSATLCAFHQKPVLSACSCGQALCITCALEHPRTGHAAVALDEAYVERTRAKLRETVERATTGSAEAIARAVDADVVRIETKARVDEIKEQVEHAFGVLKAALDQRCEILKEQLDESWTSACRVCEQHQTDDRLRWEAFEEASALALFLATDASATAPVLAKLEPFVRHRIDLLVDAAPAAPVPLADTLRFVLDGDLDHQIARAGRVERRTPTHS